MQLFTLQISLKSGDFIFWGKSEKHFVILLYAYTFVRKKVTFDLKPLF